MGDTVLMALWREFNNPNQFPAASRCICAIFVMVRTPVIYGMLLWLLAPRFLTHSSNTHCREETSEEPRLFQALFQGSVLSPPGLDTHQIQIVRATRPAKCSTNQSKSATHAVNTRHSAETLTRRQREDAPVKTTLYRDCHTRVALPPGRCGCGCGVGRAGVLRVCIRLATKQPRGEMGNLRNTAPTNQKRQTVFVSSVVGTRAPRQLTCVHFANLMPALTESGKSSPPAKGLGITLEAATTSLRLTNTAGSIGELAGTLNRACHNPRNPRRNGPA